jgi:argininosuccinate lyase
MKLWETSPSESPSNIDEFLAGEDVKLDSQLLPYELCGSMAHVMGLEKIGILTSDEVKQIRSQLSAMQDLEVEISPTDEDIHTFVENSLVASLGEIGEKIHTGRSRNDQVLVDLRLFAKEYIQQIALHAGSLAQAFLTLARNHEFTPMPGMTHTRFAMPSSIGLWASSFSESIQEAIVSIESSYQLVDQSPLGSSAGYGVPLPLDREFVSNLLGFAKVQSNTLNATCSRPRIDFSVISSLASIMYEIGRLSADLIWGSSERFEFFSIQDEYCTGSSIMPNKQNPDVLEILRAKSAQYGGICAQAFAVGQGQISGYHRDHQLLKPLLMGSLETTLNSLRILTPLISSLEINEEKLNESMTSELFAVDELIDQVNSGDPLRQAYRNVKENLDSLKVPDINDSLHKRSHPGGTGNLALDSIGEQLDIQNVIWSKRQDLFTSKLAKLLQQ